MLLTCKNVCNFISSDVLLLLAKDLPRLGAVLKTTRNMKMFEFLVNFKRLLLLILLSLAHTCKGKIYIFCHLLRILLDQGSSFLRVSMGLTVNRQMALKLTVNRQKRNIFTVNRQMSEPKLAVKLLYSIYISFNDRDRLT